MSVEHLIFQRDEWDKKLAEAAKSHIVKAATEGGAAGAERVAGMGITGAFEVDNPRIAAHLKTYTFGKIKGINETSANAYRAILTEQIEAGAGVREITKAILADPVVGVEATKYRAAMIAHTETANAMIEGNRLVHTEANADARSAGIAEPFEEQEFMPSPECCDECDAYGGTKIDITETADLPHPWCRCDWVVILSAAYGG